MWGKLMGMCCWMGSHFHDWIDYNRAVFSRELLEPGSTFSGFWGTENPGRLGFKNYHIKVDKYDIFLE